MKIKYIQIIISFLGLFLIAVNIYFDGHIFTNIAMILLAFGMMVQAYSLNRQEKKTGEPIYLGKIIFNLRTFNFFLIGIALACTGFFFVSKQWPLFIISLLAVIYFGFLWIKEIKKHSK